jgi:hypothetical protein
MQLTRTYQAHANTTSRTISAYFFLGENVVYGRGFSFTLLRVWMLPHLLPMEEGSPAPRPAGRALDKRDLKKRKGAVEENAVPHVNPNLHRYIALSPAGQRGLQQMQRVPF